ncbi:MAG: hypothetical protein KC777_16100 [Cyanobacteria bacterium HKST-UBA02]|nr:hypothetical protein [Cyanobacteria bacterium HKST-UBA02]
MTGRIDSLNPNKFLIALLPMLLLLSLIIDGAALSALLSVTVINAPTQAETLNGTLPAVAILAAALLSAVLTAGSPASHLIAFLVTLIRCSLLFILPALLAEDTVTAAELGNGVALLVVCDALFAVYIASRTRKSKTNSTLIALSLLIAALVLNLFTAGTLSVPPAGTIPFLAVMQILIAVITFLLLVSSREGAGADIAEAGFGNATCLALSASFLAVPPALCLLEPGSLSVHFLRASSFLLVAAILAGITGLNASWSARLVAVREQLLFSLLLLLALTALCPFTNISIGLACLASFFAGLILMGSLSSTSQTMNLLTGSALAVAVMATYQSCLDISQSVTVLPAGTVLRSLCLEFAANTAVLILLWSRSRRAIMRSLLKLSRFEIESTAITIGARQRPALVASNFGASRTVLAALALGCDTVVAPIEPLTMRVMAALAGIKLVEKFTAAAHSPLVFSGPIEIARSLASDSMDADWFVLADNGSGKISVLPAMPPVSIK